MRAFARIAKDEPDLALLFVGGGPFTAEEQNALTTLGIEDRAVQVNLPDSAMPAAYGNAIALVFPSRFEGFGLPALEAMACGTPTILADATSLPEVGGDAALYFHPGDDEQLAASITQVLHDPDLREKLRAAGIERAKQFTWRKAALETITAYESATRS